MVGTSDFPVKLFYYTEETGRRRTTFFFSADTYNIIQILLCAKCLSLLLFFVERHLIHGSKKDVKMNSNKILRMKIKWKLHLPFIFLLFSESCFSN